MNNHGQVERRNPDYMADHSLVAVDYTAAGHKAAVAVVGYIADRSRAVAAFLVGRIAVERKAAEHKAVDSRQAAVQEVDFLPNRIVVVVAKAARVARRLSDYH